MEIHGGLSFWIAALEIIFIDLVMSGDNALIIAMATRNLDPKNRKKAFLLGATGAIALRIFFASVVAVSLIRLPFLQFAGGLVLLYIAIKLLTESDGDMQIEPQKHLLKAVKTIVLADLVMSMDNVLAVGGASQGSVVLLIAGLLFSMTLLMAGSQLLASAMSKSDMITYMGAGVIAWVAGDMISSEKYLKPLLPSHESLYIAMFAVMTVFVTAELIQHRRR